MSHIIFYVMTENAYQKVQNVITLLNARIRPMKSFVLVLIIYETNFYQKKFVMG